MSLDWTTRSPAYLSWVHLWLATDQGRDPWFRQWLRRHPRMPAFVPDECPSAGSADAGVPAAVSDAADTAAQELWAACAGARLTQLVWLVENERISPQHRFVAVAGQGNTESALTVACRAYLAHDRLAGSASWWDGPHHTCWRRFAGLVEYLRAHQVVVDAALMPELRGYLADLEPHAPPTRALLGLVQDFEHAARQRDPRRQIGRHRTKSSSTRRVWLAAAEPMHQQPPVLAAADPEFELRRALVTGHHVLRALQHVQRAWPDRPDLWRALAEQVELSDDALAELATRLKRAARWADLPTVTIFMRSVSSVRPLFHAALRHEPAGEQMPALSGLWQQHAAALVDGLVEQLATMFARDLARAQQVVLHLLPGGHLDVALLMSQCLARGLHQPIMFLLEGRRVSLGTVCWSFFQCRDQLPALAAFGRLVYDLTRSPPLLARHGPAIYLSRPADLTSPECVLLGTCLAAHHIRLGEPPFAWQGTPVTAVLARQRDRGRISDDLMAELLEFLMDRGLRLTAEQVAELCGDPPAALGRRALLEVLLRHRISLQHFPEELRAPLLRWRAQRHQQQMQRVERAYQATGVPEFGADQWVSAIAEYNVGQEPG